MPESESCQRGSEEAVPLYDRLIPREEGHPMSDQFEIVDTGDARGRGLRSKVPFRKGERVARLSGVLTNHTTIDTIQIIPTLHLHDPWFCRFLLHGCNPNLAIDVTVMEAMATRDIRPGDYLTIDYRATEDVIEFQFPCHCGAENCCRWMRGRLEEPNEAGRAFLER